MTLPVSRSPLTDHLLSALLLVEAYEDQHPPTPLTLAALQQILQALIVDLQRLSADPPGHIPAPPTKGP